MNQPQNTIQNPDLMPQADEVLRIRKGRFASLTHRLAYKVRRLEYEVQDEVMRFHNCMIYWWKVIVKAGGAEPCFRLHSCLDIRHRPPISR